MTRKTEIPRRRANDTQVGGDYYKLGDVQLWDLWWRWNLNPFQAVSMKYILRYKKKNGIEDLRKAIHYVEKLIELEEEEEEEKKHGKDLRGKQVDGAKAAQAGSGADAGVAGLGSDE